MNTVIINSQEELDKFKEYTFYEIWRGNGLDYERYSEAHSSLLEEYKNCISASYNRSNSNQKEAFQNIYNAVFMSDTTSRFMMIDNLSILLEKDKTTIEKDYKKFLDLQDEKHIYNSYAKTQIPVYTNFFEEEFLEQRGAVRISSQDPSLNQLIINCDVSLQDGAIIDCYGNLKAKDIKCGFLGVAGKIVANDLNVEKLYAEEADVNSITCYKKDIAFSWSNALTIDADIYSALDNTFDVEFLQPSHQFGKMNDIIIGKYDYQEADNLDNPRFYANCLIDNKVENVAFFLDKHNIFNAGDLKANSVKTHSIVCGNTNVENLTCTTLLNASTLYDENKTINFYSDNDYASLNYEELTDAEQLYYPNLKYICKIPPKTRLDFSDSNVKNIVSDNIFSNNFKGEYCLSNDRFCCTGDITLQHCKSNILLGHKIEADYLHSNKAYSHSLETNILKIEESLNSDYTSVNYRFDYAEGALLESNFSINSKIIEQKEGSKEITNKPRPRHIKNEIDNNKFFKN